MSDSAPSLLFRRISRLSAWPLHHIRWKIVLPYAFLTAVLAASGAYLATQLITGSLEERFDNQLAEAGRVAADAVVRTEREHLETVRAVAFTEGVPQAARASDQAMLDSLVEPIVINGAVERLEILDGSGQRLKTYSLIDSGSLAYEEINDEDDPGTWPLVEKVIDRDVDALGDKYAQVVQTTDGFVFYTAGPIFAGDELAGVVLVGTMLESFVAITEAEALADVTVYDFDGNPLATTFAQPEGTSSNEASLDVAGEVVDGA